MLAWASVFCFFGFARLLGVQVRPAAGHPAVVLHTELISAFALLRGAELLCCCGQRHVVSQTHRPPAMRQLRLSLPGFKSVGAAFGCCYKKFVFAAIALACRLQFKAIVRVCFCRGVGRSTEQSECHTTAAGQQVRLLDCAVICQHVECFPARVTSVAPCSATPSLISVFMSSYCGCAAWGVSSR